jgi:hypothetical protein
MATLQEHIDDLDRMIDGGNTTKDAVRSQIAFIGREVAALEADYARLNEAHTNLKEAHTNLKNAQPHPPQNELPKVKTVTIKSVQGI